MAAYTVNPRGSFLSIIPNSLRFEICGKYWRVGLSLGPSDLNWILVNPKRLGDKKIPHSVGG